MASSDIVHRLRYTDGFLALPVADENDQKDRIGFGINLELFREAADEIERLRSVLSAIAAAPMCADPQHRHQGTCSPFSSAGFRNVTGMASRALAEGEV